ncbi:Os12g0600000 [Oryza sativa Japonica Group]|uniref:Os12g0600000 protein n=2 Tax=Oryza sativa subsp. japonica TaxID=39947 RepID=Q0IM44_ORYSJ|nr:uncharacterized protein LOC4352714 [Oryza sativa Japonica Group]KAB8118096.1 hypothetical protein EE612_060754 [Oryza sativa]BAF30221.1 Os12g0600000 [Oryza sativa Japonica Group]BAT17947.1 Os12g0600000 [Oryza sativa Japonica Group]|eukprot:NP_001067202.1 Os12g0600000 [Oryza sativa Japonica Group]
MALGASYARDTPEHAAPPPVVEADAEQRMTTWTQLSCPTSASGCSASLQRNVAMLASTSGGNCSEMMVVTCPLRRPTCSCVVTTAAASPVAGHRRRSSSPASPRRLPPQHAGQPAQEKMERRGRDR